MEKLEEWFLEQAQTPTGSLLLFVLVFLARISVDRYSHRRRCHKARKGKEAKAHG